MRKDNNFNEKVSVKRSIEFGQIQIQNIDEEMKEFDPPSHKESPIKFNESHQTSPSSPTALQQINLPGLSMIQNSPTVQEQMMDSHIHQDEQINPILVITNPSNYKEPNTVNSEDATSLREHRMDLKNTIQPMIIIHQQKTPKVVSHF